MILNQTGEIADKCLADIPNHIKNVHILKSIIMPNHIHILVQTHDRASLPNPNTDRASLHNSHYHRISALSHRTLPNLISQLKSTVKRICNQNNLYFSWQSGYHDQIIHSRKHLLAVIAYIENNPNNWENDPHCRADARSSI